MVGEGRPFSQPKRTKGHSRWEEDWAQGMNGWHSAVLRVRALLMLEGRVPRGTRALSPEGSRLHTGAGPGPELAPRFGAGQFAREAVRLSASSQLTCEGEAHLQRWSWCCLYSLRKVAGMGKEIAHWD